MGPGRSKRVLFDAFETLLRHFLTLFGFFSTPGRKARQDFLETPANGRLDQKTVTYIFWAGFVLTKPNSDLVFPQKLQKGNL